MKPRLAIHDATFLKPLLFGLDRTGSPFELVVDSPAQNSIKFSERSEEIRGAFLSPIDYARHGGDYCIVPHICASSSNPTGTIQLVLKSNLLNIESLAVDIRYTSEIILAKILLAEKYRNQANRTSLTIFPMGSSLDMMLQKADAALVVTDGEPLIERQGVFTLDLVEEWNDLTGLPYVHGCWVGREDEFNEEEAKALFSAKQIGMPLLQEVARILALKKGLSEERVYKYLSSFSYDLGTQEEESLQEFFQYSFFHGILGDAPELMYFDLQIESTPKNN
jgi:predicted solute-binding protein